jgi:hypothetical protein
MVNLESIGVPLCGVGPLTTPPPFVLMLFSGGIKWEGPPRCLLMPIVVALPAVIGGTSAIPRAPRVRAALLGMLCGLVVGSPSCSGRGRLLLSELISGIITCQSLRDWRFAEFGGGRLRLGRRAPSRLALGSRPATFTATKFEGPTLGLGLPPTPALVQFVGLSLGLGRAVGPALLYFVYLVLGAMPPANFHLRQRQMKTQKCTMRTVDMATAATRPPWAGPPGLDRSSG